MPKTSIKLFALFKYPFQRRASLLLFNQCFIPFLILCSSSCRGGIGKRRSKFGGNRPWTLFFVYDLAWKNLGAVIVKWTSSLFLWHVRPNASCSLKPLKIEILVRKASEIFSVHACCIEVLFSLARFWISMIPGRSVSKWNLLDLVDTSLLHHTSLLGPARFTALRISALHETIPVCALEGADGFCDTKETRKCNKIAWQKIGEPKGLADFLSWLLSSLVRSDKILSRRSTPVALVYNTRWQFFAK